jgi:hypothetical protein
VGDAIWHSSQSPTRLKVVEDSEKLGQRDYG